ncbi:hypothetical protein NECID01_1000 [Nematocida sp. AWRm77]|nr:hypothetical protein NECID01_1000 [Nematocida sp. AWRm77]
MYKTAFISGLISVLGLCIASVPVTFVLKDQSTANDVIPLGVFKMIDFQASSCHSQSLMQTSAASMQPPQLPSQTPAPSTGAVTIVLTTLQSNSLYWVFRSLWKTHTLLDNSRLGFATVLKLQFGKMSNPSANPACNVASGILPKAFRQFIRTAGVLEIQGPALENFSRIMIKHGLLGMHSHKILEISAKYSFIEEARVVWHMFMTFLTHIGLVATVDHIEFKKSTLIIKKSFNKYITHTNCSEFPRNIYKVYLWDQIPENDYGEELVNHSLLKWFLHSLNYVSVHLEYTVELSPQPYSLLLKTVTFLSRRCSNGQYLSIDGVSFIICISTTGVFLQQLFQQCPYLLSVYIHTKQTFVGQDAIAIAKAFSSCTNLKMLFLIGSCQYSLFLSQVLQSIPNICVFYATCHILDLYIIDALKNCPQLTNLSIKGKSQTNSFMEVLLVNMPCLVVLKICCKALTHSTIIHFKKLQHLKTLIMYGNKQPSYIAQEIVKHALNLVDFAIWTKSFDQAPAGCFKDHQKLKTLSLKGEMQYSHTLMEILEGCQNLVILQISCQTLDQPTIDSFKKCVFLENLELYGICQSQTVASHLLSSIPSIRTLSIAVKALDSRVAKGLKECTELRSLSLRFNAYQKGFLHCFLQDPDVLKKLMFIKFHKKHNWTIDYSADDELAIEIAIKKGVVVDIERFDNLYDMLCNITM